MIVLVHSGIWDARMWDGFDLPGAVGELDKRDFHRIAERLARGIPDSRFALIEGAGHLPALERPGATAGVVREFLDI